MANKRCACLTLAGFLLLVGIGAIIMGVIMPTYIDDEINKTVRESITINYANWDAEDISDFLTSNTTYRYYFWNITNFEDARANGAKLQVQEVGPYEYEEVTYKYNVTFNNDGTKSTVQYNAWWKKIPMNERALNAKKDKIFGLNTAYFFGVANLRNSGAPQAESSLLLSFAESTIKGSATQTGVRDSFEDPDGDLLSGFRIQAGIPMYLAGVAATLQTTQSGVYTNANLVVAQWADRTVQPGGIHTVGSGASLASSDFQFELGGIDNTVAGRLWSSVDPFSLTNTATNQGINVWLGALVEVGNSAPGAAFTALVGEFGQVTVSNVLTWIQTVSNKTNPFFLGVVGNVLKSENHFPPATTITSWSTIGQWQFCCGGISNISAPGVYTVTGASPAAAYRGPEFAAFGHGTAFATKSLTIEQGADLLSKFSHIGNISDFAGRMVALGAATDSGTQLTIAGGIASRYGSLGATNIDAMQSIANYITSYIPQNNVFLPVIIGGNSGAFAEHTPHELLFGHDDALLGLGGANFPGFATTYTDKEEHYTRTNQGLYKLNTGDIDINRARTYGAWRGTERFSTVADLRRADECFPSVANCDTVWTSEEVIDGSSPGGSFPPFQEGNVVSTVRVFIVEAMRSADLVYDRAVTYKGIEMSRYILSEPDLQNSTLNPTNAKYLMNGPNGVAPMHTLNRGAPVVLTRPHMMGVDAHVRQQTVGQMPNGELHDTEIRVEPLSGFTMYGTKKFQLSMRVAKSSIDNPYYGKLFDNDNEIYVPVFWGEEAGEIKDEDAADFREGVYDNRNLGKWLQIGGWAVGLTFVVIGVLLCVYWLRRGSTPTSTKFSTQASSSEPSSMTTPNFELSTRV
jgi:CD36 family